MAERDKHGRYVKKEQKAPEIVDPKTYFNKLKGKKQKCTDEVLNGIYTNCMVLMEKYSTNSI